MINFLRMIDQKTLDLHLRYPDVGPLGNQRRAEDYNIELGKEVFCTIKDSFWCPSQQSYEVLASLLNVLIERKNSVLVYETCLKSLNIVDNAKKFKEKLAELGFSFQETVTLTIDMLENFRNEALQSGASREEVNQLVEIGTKFIKEEKLKKEFEQKIGKENADIMQSKCLIGSALEDCGDSKLLWSQNELKNMIQELCQDKGVSSSVQSGLISDLSVAFIKLKNETYNYLKNNTYETLTSSSEDSEDNEKEFFEVLSHLGRIDEEFYEAFSELLYAKLMEKKGLRTVDVIVNTKLLISMINCFICYLSQDEFSFEERQNALEQMLEYAKKRSPNQLSDMREFIIHNDAFKSKKHSFKMKNDSN